VSDLCRDSIPHTRVLVFNVEHDTEICDNPPVGAAVALFVGNGRRARWRGASSVPNVFAAHEGVFFVGGQVQLCLSITYGLFEDLLQKGPTPTTTSPSTKTVAQLGGSLGFFDPDVVHKLSLRHVKT